MAGQGQASAMYEALMAVKPEGWSLNKWATEANINRSMFNAIAKHGNPTRTTMEKLLGAIGMSLSDFEARSGTVQSEVRGTGMSPQDLRETWALPRARPVPVLGTAFGSELEEVDGIETTELMLSEVLDYVARPSSLANDDTAYAVTTIGDSMAPRFEPGEIVFVSPKAPVHVGDDVLVQLRAPGDSGSEDDQAAGRVTIVLLKRLVRRTSTTFELRQFNPDKTFEVPASRVRRIHKVRGRL